MWKEFQNYFPITSHCRLSNNCYLTDKIFGTLCTWRDMVLRETWSALSLSSPSSFAKLFVSENKIVSINNDKSIAIGYSSINLSIYLSIFLSVYTVFMNDCVYLKILEYILDSGSISDWTGTSRLSLFCHCVYSELHARITRWQVDHRHNWQHFEEINTIFNKHPVPISLSITTSYLNPVCMTIG